MQHPLRFLSTCIIALACTSMAHAQCTEQVIHTSGTQVVGGSNVTVSSTGVVTTNSVYCSETFPYFIGHNGGNSGTGSYTFDFSPPIPMAAINVSGISEVIQTHLEHVRIFYNGAHYFVPAPGVQLSCDPLGIVTPDGDIGPCTNCSVSGMGPIMVPGPISTLTVQDSVLMGDPAGAIFSLFLCGEGTAVTEAGGMGQQQPWPNPATTTLSLPHTGGVAAAATLHDTQGRLVRSIERTAGDRTMPVADLPRGAYVLVIHEATPIRRRIILE